MRQWYQIEAKSNKTAEILIYEQIGEDFWGDGVSAKRFVEDLQALDVDTIELRINSPGGNVFDGNAIYNALVAHKAEINVTVDGIAASIASVVAMSGDTVILPENAIIMIHDPSGVVMGTAADMTKTAEALEKIKGGLVSAYRNKSDLDNDRISEMMTDETWMTAIEAQDFGFADVVISKVNIQANLKGLSQYKNVPNSLLAKVSNVSNKQTTKKKEVIMGGDKSQTQLPEITLDFLRANHTDIVTALVEEGRQEGSRSGAEQERARIKAVKDQLIPGHEELINTLMWDGKTTGEQAAVQILAAEKVLREKKLEDLGADAPDAVAHAVPPGSGEETAKTEDASLPIEERAKAEWDKDRSLHAEFGDYDTYLAYRKAEASGKFMVLGKK